MQPEMDIKIWREENTDERFSLLTCIIHSP
jgi:hypothetical protein